MTSLFASPPVVQQASETGFTVSIEVGQLCTGRVEWGFSPADLSQTAIASHGGLVEADARCLMIPVRLHEPIAPGQSVFYRVVAAPLVYHTAYEIERGAPVATAVHQLKLPHRDASAVSMAIINDTHGNPETISALVRCIETEDPDLLVWNGDVCHFFSQDNHPATTMLQPGSSDSSSGGWASSRPLLYVAGNHDARGSHARLLRSVLAAGLRPRLPWNTARRIGPLAILALDTGEDKPDHHPVFAGTAAFEPYRVQQARWLAGQLARPDIAKAPFRVVFSHIPLRGRPGENDGTALEGYARYAGHGASLWLPLLHEARCHAIVSGHTHEWRIDDPSEACPLTQVVGGGPLLGNGTTIMIHAAAARLSIIIKDLDGNTLATRVWESRSS